MQGFLISLLALALASFLCIFGIGAVAFRKDILAAYQERKKSLSTAATQESSTPVMVTSETEAPARTFTSGTKGVLIKVVNAPVYTQALAYRPAQIFIPRGEDRLDLFSEGTSSFFSMPDTRATVMGAT